MIKETMKIYLPKSKVNMAVDIKDGSKGDILFFHGLGCSKESFTDAFSSEHLKGYRLIVPDLIGFGVSSTVSEKTQVGMKCQAEYIKELMAVLGIKKPIIISHSMGGAVALLLTKMIEEHGHFFSLEGNLLESDCDISKKVALMSQSNFLEVEYPNNIDKYRYRYLPEGVIDNPISFYKCAVSLVHESENDKLLKIYKSLRSPRTYIYGEKSKNTKTTQALVNEDILKISDASHFMMNKNPHETYLGISKRI